MRVPLNNKRYLWPTDIGVEICKAQYFSCNPVLSFPKFSILCILDEKKPKDKTPNCTFLVNFAAGVHHMEKDYIRRYYNPNLTGRWLKFDL